MKKKLVYALFIIVCLVLPVMAHGALYNGHDYVVVYNSGLSWQDAAADIARTLGSGYHLAAVTSLGEQQFISSLLGSGHGEFWLGGYQPEGTSNLATGWRWVTGEGWTFNFWRPGTISDYPLTESEYYLSMKAYGSGWRWKVGDVQNIVGYVAESYANVPLPGALVLMCSGLTALAGVRAYGVRRSREKVTY